MALLVENVLVAGVGMSARNRAGILADAPSELLAVCNRLTMDLFMDAAVANPFYIGASEAVLLDPVQSVWLRPVAALSVVRIEAIAGETLPAMDAGTEVLVVQPDDLAAGRFSPYVVEMGGIFKPGGTPESPTGGSLRVFYARRPQLLTLGGALTQVIDAAIPRDMEMYYVAGVAHYLAMKDQRLDEIPVLQALRDDARGLWGRLIGSATPATRRVFLPRTALPLSTDPAA